MNSTDLDALWVAVAAVLVMVAGIGLVVMVQGGTRHRSVSTGAARFVAQFASAVLAFALLGFGLGFGSGEAWLGTEWFGLEDVPFDARLDHPNGSTVGGGLLLHTAAAVVFVGIVLAPLAERTRVVGHAIAAALLAGVVLPLALRSVWGGGLIDDIQIGGAGYVDAAGGGVVATLAGWLGLTGTMLIGPRLGRFGPTGRARVIPGRSMPVATIGGLFVAVGWLGFTMGFPDPWSDAQPEMAIVSLLAAASGSLTAMLVSWRRSGAAGALSAIRGLVAGVVSISAGVGSFSPLWAAGIGAIAGLLVIPLVVLGERARVDDPLGAVAVFGGAGMWGVLAVGLFANGAGAADAGLVYGGDADQLLAQAIGVTMLSSWGIVSGAVVFGLLRAVNLLRLPADEELVGLSVSEQRSAS